MNDNILDEDDYLDEPEWVGSVVRITRPTGVIIAERVMEESRCNWHITGSQLLHAWEDLIAETTLVQWLYVPGDESASNL
jgi:hypothetical protein